jgi:O-antigen ligase
MSFVDGTRQAAFAILAPTRRSMRVGALARGLVLACAGCLLGAIVARVAISHYGPQALELAVGVPLLIFLMPRPLLAALALLVMLQTIYPYGALPRINLPGHPPLSVADVFLAVPVLGTIWRKPWRTWHPAVRTWFLLVGLMLVVATIVTAPVAAGGHTALRESILGFKNLAYLLFGLTIAQELSTSAWRRLLDGLVAIAAVVALLSVAAVAVPSFGHTLNSINSRTVQFSALIGSSTTSRVRLIGLFLVYGMLLPTMVMTLTVRDRWRSLRIIALLLMVVAVAISLNRNMYFGAVVGLGVTTLVGGPRLRHRILVTLVIVIAVIVLAVESVKPSATAEIQQRASSALSTSVLNSASAQDRSLEFRFALKSISAHPLTGVGWMEFYGLTLADLGLQGQASTDQRVYVEDWYLHMATDYGIPATILFLLVPGFLIGYGILRARSAADPAERAMVGALVGSVIALLLSCLVGTYLQSPDTMLGFATICGLLLAASMRATPYPGRPSASAQGVTGPPRLGDTSTLARS